MKLSVSSSIRDIDATQWDACTQGNALLTQAFFRSLEESGAVGSGRRIRPRYLTLLSNEGNLLGCVPAMIKVGTLAEYGPEYRWLNEGAAQGLFSWPKFQVGLPLFPVVGPKLLYHPKQNCERITRYLIMGLRQLAFEKMLVGVLDIHHIDAVTATRLAADGWLISQEIHSFWTNAAYPDYSAYLDSLPHRKRSMACSSCVKLSIVEMKEVCHAGHATRRKRDDERAGASGRLRSGHGARARGFD